MKARELSIGMNLVTADGTVKVVSIEEGESQKLYNLVVAGNSNYFVGVDRVLSHDNSIRSTGGNLLVRR